MKCQKYGFNRPTGVIENNPLADHLPVPIKKCKSFVAAKGVLDIFGRLSLGAPEDMPNNGDRKYMELQQSTR